MMGRHKWLPALGATLAIGAAAGESGDTNPRTGAPADWPQPVVDQQFFKAQVDRLEAHFPDENDQPDSYVLDAQGWYGGDYHKLWMKAEAEDPAGAQAEAAELQLLYSRTVAPFWDLQAGVRYDIEPDPERGFLVLGLQGMARYQFEVDAALYVSEDGDASIGFEAEYDVLLTQRLVLQPRLELDAAFSEVEDYGIGRGLNGIEAGVRLRYHIAREFAPYVGVSYRRLFGDTRDMADAEGEDSAGAALVLGLRAWF